MVTTTRPSQVDEDGFSLVELLIALALLLMTLGLLFPALYQSRQIFERIEQTSTHPSFEATTELVRELFAAARLPIDAIRIEDTRAFAGSAHEATFTTLLNRPGAYAGVYLVRLTLASSKTRSNTLALVATLRLHRPTSQLASSREYAYVLVDGISGGTFGYFGRHSSDSLTWAPTWQDRRRLPLLVSLATTSSDGSRVESSRLIVHLPLAQAIRER